jgi:hypothetical protein
MVVTSLNVYAQTGNVSDADWGLDWWMMLSREDHTHLTPDNLLVVDHVMDSYIQRMTPHSAMSLFTRNRALSLLPQQVLSKSGMQPCRCGPGVTIMSWVMHLLYSCPAV